MPNTVSVDFTGPMGDAKSRLLVAVNQKLNKQYSANDFDFVNPELVTLPGSQYNSKITMTPKPTSGYLGNKTVYYNRIHGNEIGDILVSRQGASRISDLLTAINTKYGVMISPDDIYDAALPAPQPNETNVSVNLVFRASSIAFYSGTRIITGTIDPSINPGNIALPFNGKYVFFSQSAKEDNILNENYLTVDGFSVSVDNDLIRKKQAPVFVSSDKNHSDLMYTDYFDPNDYSFHYGHIRKNLPVQFSWKNVAGIVRAINIYGQVIELDGSSTVWSGVGNLFTTDLNIQANVKDFQQNQLILSVTQNVNDDLYAVCVDLPSSSIQCKKSTNNGSTWTDFAVTAGNSKVFSFDSFNNDDFYITDSLISNNKIFFLCFSDIAYPNAVGSQVNPPSLEALNLSTGTVEIFPLGGVYPKNTSIETERLYPTKSWTLMTPADSSFAYPNVVGTVKLKHSLTPLVLLYVHNGTTYEAQTVPHQSREMFSTIGGNIFDFFASSYSITLAKNNTLVLDVIELGTLVPIDEIANYVSPEIIDNKFTGYGVEVLTSVRSGNTRSVWNRSVYSIRTSEKAERLIMMDSGKRMHLIMQAENAIYRTRLVEDNAILGFAASADTFIALDKHSGFNYSALYGAASYSRPNVTETTNGNYNLLPYSNAESTKAAINYSFIGKNTLTGKYQWLTAGAPNEALTVREFGSEYAFLNKTPISVGAMDGNLFAWANYNLGIYKSTDSGNTWSFFADGKSIVNQTDFNTLNTSPLSIISMAKVSLEPKHFKSASLIGSDIVYEINYNKTLKVTDRTTGLRLSDKVIESDLLFKTNTTLQASNTTGYVNTLATDATSYGINLLGDYNPRKLFYWKADNTNTVVSYGKKTINAANALDTTFGESILSSVLPSDLTVLDIKQEVAYLNLTQVVYGYRTVNSVQKYALYMVKNNNTLRIQELMNGSDSAFASFKPDIAFYLWDAMDANYVPLVYYSDRKVMVLNRFKEDGTFDIQLNIVSVPLDNNQPLEPVSSLSQNRRDYFFAQKGNGIFKLVYNWNAGLKIVTLSFVKVFDLTGSLANLSIESACVRVGASVFAPLTAYIPTVPVFGTLLTTSCSTTSKYGTYADGSGGTYIELIQDNSPDCGYVPAQPATVNARSISYNVSEGNIAVIGYDFNHAVVSDTTFDVTVTYLNTATAADHTGLTFRSGSASFAAITGGQITIPAGITTFDIKSDIVSDANVETNEGFKITLTKASGTVNIANTTSIEVTVNISDTAGPNSQSFVPFDDQMVNHTLGDDLKIVYNVISSDTSTFTGTYSTTNNGFNVTSGTLPTAIMPKLPTAQQDRIAAIVEGIYEFSIDYTIVGQAGDIGFVSKKRGPSADILRTHVIRHESATQVNNYVQVYTGTDPINPNTETAETPAFPPSTGGIVQIPLTGIVDYKLVVTKDSTNKRFTYFVNNTEVNSYVLTAYDKDDYLDIGIYISNRDATLIKVKVTNTLASLSSTITKAAANTITITENAIAYTGDLYTINNPLSVESTVKVKLNIGTTDSGDYDHIKVRALTNYTSLINTTVVNLNLSTIDWQDIILPVGCYAVNFEIKVKEDLLTEGTEAFSTSLIIPVNNTYLFGSSPLVQDFTITDTSTASSPTPTPAPTPAPTPSPTLPSYALSTSSVTVNEGQYADIVVTLSAAATAVVKINAEIAAGSSFVLSDFSSIEIFPDNSGNNPTTTTLPAQLVFAVGETYKKLRLNVSNDATTEGSETGNIAFTVDPSTPATSNTNTLNFALTISDTSVDLPSLSLATSSITVNEGSTFDVILQLSAASTNQIVVDTAIGAGATFTSADFSSIELYPDNTNTNPSAFTLPSSITFAAGETYKKLKFTVANDATTEGVETGNITLTVNNNSTAYVTNTTALSYAVTISDTSQSLPTLSLASTSSTVNEGSVVDVIITLNYAHVNPIVVNAEIASGSSFGAGDFSSIQLYPDNTGTNPTAFTIPNNITFAAGDTYKKLSFTISPDATTEGTETGNIRITVDAGSTSEVTNTTALDFALTISDTSITPATNFVPTAFKTTSNATLSNSNLTAASSSFTSAMTDFSASTDIWYFEFSNCTTESLFGICKSTRPSPSNLEFSGASDSFALAINGYNDNWSYNNGGLVNEAGSGTIDHGKPIGFVLNLTTNKLSVWQNNTKLREVTIPWEAGTAVSIGCGGSNSTVTINTGATPFYWAVPNGAIMGFGDGTIGRETAGPLPTVGLVTSSSTVNEGNVIDIELTLSNVAQKDLTLSTSYASGTTFASADFSSIELYPDNTNTNPVTTTVPGTITFAKGELYKKLKLTVASDVTTEGTESGNVRFTVSSTTPYVTNTTPIDYGLTISDTSVAYPTLTLNPSSSTANEGTTVDIEVQLSSAYTSAIKINTDIAAGAGFASSDFTAISLYPDNSGNNPSVFTFPGQITFAAGETYKKLRLIVSNDVTTEGNESGNFTFIKDASTPYITNATTLNYTLTILDTSQSSFVPTTFRTDSTGTLSNGNLTVNTTISQNGRSSFTTSSGKWYIEFSNYNTNSLFGVGLASRSNTSPNYPGNDSASVGVYVNNGQWLNNSDNIAGQTQTTALIKTIPVGLLIDIPGNKISAWQNNAKISEATLPWTAGSEICVLAGYGSSGGSGNSTLNAGATDFYWIVPDTATMGFGPGSGAPVAGPLPTLSLVSASSTKNEGTSFDVELSLSAVAQKNFTINAAIGAGATFVAGDFSSIQLYPDATNTNPSAFVFPNNIVFTKGQTYKKLTLAISNDVTTEGTETGTFTFTKDSSTPYISNSSALSYALTVSDTSVTAPTDFVYDSWTTGTGETYTNSNRTCTVSANKTIRSIHSQTTGKWYFEMEAIGLTYQYFGICRSDVAYDYNVDASTGTNSLLCYTGSSNLRYSDGAVHTSTINKALSINRPVGFAIDLDNRVISIYQDNEEKIRAAIPWAAGISVSIVAGHGTTSGSTETTINSGYKPFDNTPPPGYIHGFGNNIKVPLPTSALYPFKAASTVVVTGQSLITDDSIYQSAITGNLILNNAETTYKRTSIYLNGSNGGAIALATNQKITTEDFTIEFRIFKLNNTSQDHQRILQLGNNAEPHLNIKGTYSTGTYQIYVEYTPNGSTYTNILVFPLANCISNTSQHVAITRNSSGEMKGFINGKQVATGTFTDNANGSNLYIGQNSANGEKLNGYLQDIVITKGQALYTADFTPCFIYENKYKQTNPYYVNTSFVLIGDSSSFVDVSQYNRSPSSTAGTIAFTNSIAAYNQSGSINFTNSLSNTLNYDVGNSCQFGTNDFTIEFNAAKSANGNQNYDIVAATTDNGNGTNGWFVELSSIRGLCFSGPNISVINYVFNPNDDLMHHYAITRADGVIYLWKDGALLTSSAQAGDITSLTTLTLGKVGNNYPFNGNLSNLQIINGYCKYRTAFTPKPLTENPYSSGVLLKIDAETDLLDKSSTTKTLTATGTVTRDTTGKLNGKGSVYFNNDSSYWSVSSPSSFEMGTEDFTIVMMINYSSLTNNPRPFSITNGTTGIVQLYVNGGTLGVEINNAGAASVSGGSISTNRNYQIAITKRNGVIRVFIDGKKLHEVTNAVSLPIPANVMINQFGSATTNSNQGYIDSILMLKGTALFTSNYNPVRSLSHY